MKPRKILAIVILLVAAVFWVTAILSASKSGGFVEDEFAVQTMVLGGAISMVAGLFAFVLD